MSIASLPLSAWPPRHRELWDSRVAQSPNFLEETGPASWAERTRKEARKNYGQWLQWLASRGQLGDDDPHVRVTETLFRQFLRDQRTRLNLTTLSTQVYHICELLKCFAPESDWSWIQKMRNRVKREASRQPVARPRLVHAQMLFDLGLDLLISSTKDVESDKLDAGRYLDGLLIALFIAAPVRISNFSALELGHHLVRATESWHLHLDGTETKTGAADHSSLPATLTNWLNYYADTVRPALLKSGPDKYRATTRFWIGLHGGPLSDQLIRKCIKQRTTEAFGFSISPHTFRKIAETTFIVERPEYAAYGPALLGHRSARTTERHYFTGQRQLALQTYREALLQRTKKSGHCGEERAEHISDVADKMKMLTLCSLASWSKQYG